MEKNEITEILNMPFDRFITRYAEGYKKESLYKYVLELPFVNENTRQNITVKDVLFFTKTDWLQIQGLGKATLHILYDAYERFGLRFGMTKGEIAALENKTENNTSPTLSFQDYINTLKHFADNAGACAITNEFVTEDGYKISFKIEKTTK